MIISRLVFLALALTSLSIEANAGQTTRHTVASTSLATADFGSCAKGPCIRQAGAHSKAHN